jgi:hypothetical protein
LARRGRPALGRGAEIAATEPALPELPEREPLARALPVPLEREPRERAPLARPVQRALPEPPEREPQVRPVPPEPASLQRARQAAGRCWRGPYTSWPHNR